MKTKVISVCNKKGGVGKTTATANIAAALAKLGEKVLVIDGDSQMNLTSTLGLNHENTGALSTCDLLYFAVAGQPIRPEMFVCHNVTENIDIIMGNKLLDSAPSFLATKADGSTVLRSVLLQPGFQKYDWILIDCRPCLDLVVVNALAASDGVIIPLEAEEYALDGLLDLLDVVAQTRDRVNPGLEIYGILVNKADPRRNLTKTTLADLRSNFGEAVFDTVIPILAEAPAAAAAHHTCVVDSKSRLGAAFVEVAKEVLKRGSGR